IGELDRRFKAYTNKNPLEKIDAEAFTSRGLSDIMKAWDLSNCLWDGRLGYRFTPDKFRLTEAVDAQLSRRKTKEVANCRGLTALYSVLGIRNALNLSVFTNEGHCMSMLDADGRKAVIWTTNLGIRFDPASYDGFNSRGLLHLVAQMYFSTAREKRCNQEAIIEYGKAIETDPAFLCAYFERALAKERIGDMEGAKKDYAEHMRLSGESHDA
ncbi:MAG TPA: hypothetical protein HA362_06900, partial [Nanoarchaeota archaeon]|nr:hypothetical protein [Nanoarchaeota archaeon]